jgi:hypothetical protein
MKDEILQLFENGKIEETHFTILDARLTERLRDMRTETSESQAMRKTQAET